MKALQALFFTLATAFIAPVVIGLVDAYTWLMTGEQVSWMDWNHNSVMMAWAFLFPAAGAAIAGFGIRDAADR
jgi:hypothetical protein